MKQLLRSLHHPFFLAVLVFLLLELLPLSRTYSQQRSAYDLAAWIIAAANDNDTTGINWALKEGGQIDFKRGGSNALQMAIYRKNAAMVRFLLQKGASVDSVDYEGMGALQYAKKMGNPEVIQLISAKIKGETAPVINETRGDITGNKKPATPGGKVMSAARTYRYKPGENVLISRDKGKTWEPGTIKDVNVKFIEEGLPPYLVENKAKTDQRYLDPNFITTLTRQPAWTSFFIGDWDLYLPIAATNRVIDRDVYQIISGGDRLPPLRINSDGTFTWVTPNKTMIKGKWRENNHAPGIILMQGEGGADWLVYNTSDDKNRKIFKSDYIILSPVTRSDTPKHGFRIKDPKK